VQHTDIAAPHDLRLLGDGAGMVEQGAALDEDLLAPAREEEPSPDTVEELEAEIVLEVGDLARQRGLGDMKSLCCLGDRAYVGHRDECANVAQVHDRSSCRMGITIEADYILDASRLPFENRPQLRRRS
jgi:hypothetical protein